MKTNQDYKNAALAALKGNWAPAVVCAICYVAIIVCYILPYELSYFSFLGTGEISLPDTAAAVLACLSVAIMWFLVYPMSVGLFSAFRRLYVEGDDNLTANLFKDTFIRYFHNLGGIILMYVFVILWSMLLIVPGIIKSFSYAMTPFILRDWPELSPNQAINLSCKMMKGHKFDLFYLDISFIGWGILSVFTLGIGLFWLVPYMQTAFAAFYEDIKEEYNSKNNINL